MQARHISIPCSDSYASTTPFCGLSSLAIGVDSFITSVLKKDPTIRGQLQSDLEP